MQRRADRAGRLTLSSVPPPLNLLCLQSALSSARGMNIAIDRAPLARPAMPIDIAALAYHSSALKMTRLIFFLTGRARDATFLALAFLDVLLFGIFTPATPLP